MSDPCDVELRMSDRGRTSFAPRPSTAFVHVDDPETSLDRSALMVDAVIDCFAFLNLG